MVFGLWLAIFLASAFRGQIFVVGQPASFSRREGWQIFNERLTTVTKAELTTAAAALRNTADTPVYDVNFQLAKDLRAALTESFKIFVLYFNVLVWDTTLPHTANGAADLTSVGAAPYMQCMKPASYSASMEVETVPPCKEGGSIYTSHESPLFESRSKNIMAFYTGHSVPPAALLTTAEVGAHLGGIYRTTHDDAKSACFDQLRSAPIALDRYVSCMHLRLSVVLEPGHSSFRGFAAMIQLPPAGAYAKPGYTFPQGHLFLDVIDFADIFPKQPAMHQGRIWLAAYGPVVLPKA